MANNRCDLRGPWLLLLAVTPCVLWAQPESAIPLTSGSSVTDFADSILQPKRYFTMHLLRGQEFNASVTSAFSDHNRFRISLYALSPDGPQLLDEASPIDDGRGGPSVAKITRTITMDRDYYLEIWVDRGAANFAISATWTGSPASLPTSAKCLTGKIEEIGFLPNGEVEWVVIAGTRVGPAALLSLPKSPALRAALPLGHRVRACFDSTGIINRVTLVP
jgi:hypothetical protein